MDFNRWWNGLPEERYWLEVTDRPDLGADLRAPQVREGGSEYYGYSLLTEVRPGDVVFHYHKNECAIVAVSEATGAARAARIVWGAHGATARGLGIAPYERAGWRVGLCNLHALEPPLTLEEIRHRGDEVRLGRTKLEATAGVHLYSPFETSFKRPLRPTQAYLSKLPRYMVELFPALQDALPVTESEYLALASEPTLDPSRPLDGLQLTKARREQAFLRDNTLGPGPVATCGFCGRLLPQGLMVAAHIKRRSACSDDEKRDYKNLMIPACRFGCDDLYERGYIVVDENGVIASLTGYATTPDLNDQVSALVGRVCPWWTVGSEPYFAWHREFHRTGHA